VPAGLAGDTRRPNPIVERQLVVRTGTSIRVCRDAIRATGDERPVVAITLANAITGQRR
jgi:hypothetical protein